MYGRASNGRASGSTFASRLSYLMLTMFAVLSAVYVAGRLWQDAENRARLFVDLDKRSGQGVSAISVEDTLKIIACREQKKKFSAVEKDLAAAGLNGFASKYSTSENASQPKKKLLAVIGIMTTFGRRRNRNAIRQSWMPTGGALRKLEDEKGIVLRFVIGRSAIPGDNFDKEIDIENRLMNDFIILVCFIRCSFCFEASFPGFQDDQVEGTEEKHTKTKEFIAQAAEKWDAEFYVKVNDDVYLDIEALGATLSAFVGKPRAYIGCMKSGEVFSDPTHKWHEPDWWKFGDAKSYAGSFGFLRSLLRTYAHEDVSTGSWFIGLDVAHIHERKFCCSSFRKGPPQLLVYSVPNEHKFRNSPCLLSQYQIPFRAISS
ncbi:Hydroxyproline O-galactosyltransferase HPGT1 [Linum perenne]